MSIIGLGVGATTSASSEAFGWLTVLRARGPPHGARGGSGSRAQEGFSFWSPKQLTAPSHAPWTAQPDRVTIASTSALELPAAWEPLRPATTGEAACPGRATTDSSLLVGRVPIMRNDSRGRCPAAAHTDRPLMSADAESSPATFVDLFSGAGGFTLGFHSAGFSLESLAVEIDTDCSDTFRHNFAMSKILESDVRDADFSSIQADVVVAGPPCQGFSKLNRYRSDDDRNDLYLEVLRAVDAINPQVVVVENVPAFLQSAAGADCVNGLRGRGFAVRQAVVNVADHGVPQHRKRALVVAARPGTALPWPVQTHAARRANVMLPHRTVSDAFALLPTEPDGRNWHRPYVDRAYAARYRSIPEGGGRKDLPPDLVLDCWRKTDGFSDVFGRLLWGRPSTTIRTEFFRAEKGRFLHPTADRPITAREAARLQSFPDSFTFPEEQTLQSVARQIGNAMPPKAAEAIGREVLRSIRGRVHEPACRHVRVAQD